MTAAVRARKSQRLDIRVSAEQKALFEDAAAATSRTLSEFVTQAATLAAQDALADRTRFVIDANAWAAFSAALARPPRHLPRLAALMTQPSVLDSE